MGMDLCRAVLIYENLYIPPELEHLYGPKNNSNAGDFSSMFANELKEN